MQAGAGFIAQSLGIEIAQSQVSSCLIRVQCQQLFQLVRRVLRMARRLEGEGKIISGIGRIRADGDGGFPGGGGGLEVSHLKRHQSHRVMRLKIAAVHRRRAPVMLNRFRQALGPLRLLPFRQFPFGRFAFASLGQPPD